MNKYWQFEDEDNTDDQDYEYTNYYSSDLKKDHMGQLSRKRGGRRDEFALRRSARRAKRKLQRLN